MTMQLDETIQGIWYCPTIPGKQDFLMALNRMPNGGHQITYRFRYYHSDDPFDEEDEKSWYSGEAKGQNEEEIIETIHNTIMPTVAMLNGGTFTEILRGNRPYEEFLEEFMKQDFVHTKKVH